jgi:hypothetical protein
VSTVFVTKTNDVYLATVVSRLGKANGFRPIRVGKHNMDYDHICHFVTRSGYLAEEPISQEVKPPDALRCMTFR